jgi:hypothetical protein
MYNEKTRELMDNDTVCQIVIGTDTLLVGVDIGSVQDVIVLDEPEDIDDLFQKFGPPGRDRKRVKDPRGILYTGQKTLETAQRGVDAARSHGSSKKVTLEKETNTMDLSMAHMHLANCNYAEQNRQYGNTPNGILWTDSCRSCQEDPPPSPVFPCYCSGCKPEDILPADVPMRPTRNSAITLDIPKSKRLTKAMRAHGTKQLEKFRVQVWNNVDENKYGFLPPQVFLPDSDIKLVLDYFTLLDSLTKISALIEHNLLLNGWHNALLETIVVFRVGDSGRDPAMRFIHKRYRESSLKRPSTLNDTIQSSRASRVIRLSGKT